MESTVGCLLECTSWSGPVAACMGGKVAALVCDACKGDVSETEAVDGMTYGVA